MDEMGRYKERISEEITKSLKSSQESDAAMEDAKRWYVKFTGPYAKKMDEKELKFLYDILVAEK